MDLRMQMEAVSAGQRMSLSKSLTAERKLLKDPSDVLLRLKLLGFYWQYELNNCGVSLARFRHVLWIIDNFPDFTDLLQDYVALDRFPLRLWQQAADRWNLQINKNEHDAAVLFNSGMFFISRDFKTGQLLLKRAQALDPENQMLPFTLCNRTFAQISTAIDKEEKTRLAHSVILDGERASHLGFPYHQAAWICVAAMSQAALLIGDLDKANIYAEKAPLDGQIWEPSPVEFKNAMLGLIALRKGKINAARGHLLQIKGNLFAGLLPFQLAEELLEIGEQDCVAEYLSQYLRTEVKACDAAFWLENVKAGLIP